MHMDLPEDWALREHPSGRGPDYLKHHGHTVAMIFLVPDFPMPVSPSIAEGSFYSAERWFWKPVPGRQGVTQPADGYGDYAHAFADAFAYAQSHVAEVWS